MKRFLKSTLVALFAFLSGPKNASAWQLFAVLTLWSIRIGIFLLVRVLKNKKDDIKKLQQNCESESEFASKPQTEF